jgi:putative ATPase
VTDSLFSGAAPLAARMRPRNLDEVCGQAKALLPGSPLQSLANPDLRESLPSVILWGPPGSGKTSIAHAVANSSSRKFVELSALTAGVKEVREVLSKAELDGQLYSRQTILFLDEIHRFSKNQQDSLLSAVEKGVVTLIAATTENPSFSVISPLLSRSLVVELSPLSAEDVISVLKRALIDPRGLSGKFVASNQVLDAIVSRAGGDARRALTILEASALRRHYLADSSEILIEDVEASFEGSLVRYDRDGDQHYDTISAFIKSVRGSDVDAALHYLARMLQGGEDPRFIARRLIILASEDIGLADPDALPLAIAAMAGISHVGMPEGRILLSEATIYLCLAPKSNSAYLAIDSAISSVKSGFLPEVPLALRSSNFSKREAADPYVYPHDEENQIAEQIYVPEVPRYYLPKQTGREQQLGDRWSKIRAILRGE